jgi:dihydrofolate reductase
MYQVAMSAHGFIAGPNGEHDWITMDPSIDFIAQCGQFDTAIMGRPTYANAVTMHGDASLPGLDVVVFSRTLPPGQSCGARILQEDARKWVRETKAAAGRDIWLFGGGVLAGQLLDAGLIDSIDVAIMPVALGKGARLFEAALPMRFRTVDHVVLEKSAHKLRGTRARSWSRNARFVVKVDRFAGEVAAKRRSGTSYGGSPTGRVRRGSHECR